MMALRRRLASRRSALKWSADLDCIPMLALDLILLRKREDDLQ
jgi:hypothetical protein